MKRANNMGISALTAGYILLVGHACFVAAQDRHPGFRGALKHVHEINSHSQKYLSKNNGRSTSHEEKLFSLLNEDLAARAEEILASDWSTASNNSKYDVSSLCLNHTEMILNGIMAGDMWALRMIDSMGKPPSGLLDFNIAWLGSFDECVSVEVMLSNTTGPTTPFSTQYCLAMMPLGDDQSSMLEEGPAVKIGMCLPKSCSNEDVGALANTLLSLIPSTLFNTSQLPLIQGLCKSNGDLEWDGEAIFSIVVCSIFLAVMTVATAYDIYIQFYLNQNGNHNQLPKYKPTTDGYGAMQTGHVTDKTPLLPVDQSQESQVHIDDLTKATMQPKKYQSGTAGKVLLAFSVYTNATKLLNTSQPAGTLTAVNGIRFFSMLWVILGHTYAFGMNTTENVATYVPAMFKRLTFQVIGNGTISVDTFFVLSGLLLGYLGLKEMNKRGGATKYKWGMYYFHRYWRLTPPYMLVMMLYVPLVKYWIKGPLAPEGGLDQEECRDTWWHNLLYINNFFADSQGGCMAWSWYLANDMQFYIVSPLMLIPLYYSKLWGAVSCLAFVATGTITTGALSKYYELSSNLAFDPNQDDAFVRVYIKPWCRIAPYAVGLYTGYLLYKTDCKVKISKMWNVIGWSLSTVVALLLLYGLYQSDGNIYKLGVDMAALYNATFRLAWGICVCWVVFACATGYGGPVNTLLSWRAIIPLSRLTYCAYLVHPVVIYTYYFNRRTMMYWYDLEVTYIFLAHTCIAFSVAFIVSLAFESPIMGVEKTLLGHGKKN